MNTNSSACYYTPPSAESQGAGRQEGVRGSLCRAQLPSPGPRVQRQRGLGHLTSAATPVQSHRLAEGRQPAPSCTRPGMGAVSRCPSGSGAGTARLPGLPLLSAHPRRWTPPLSSSHSQGPPHVRHPA